MSVVECDDVGRACCEDAVLALEESSRSESAGDREARAEEAADRCFSRTLFPRALQAGVLRLRACVSAALEALEGLQGLLDTEEADDD